MSTFEETAKQINKQFGAGSIMRLDQDDVVPVEVISTGSIGLNKALGVGGVPRGRIIEIFGPESSGKTTLALHIIAEGQKTGGAAAFLDAEHAMDPAYAEALGVNLHNLWLSQPTTAEQCLSIAETIVRDSMDVIVIDSVAALVPKAELEGEMGDAHMGLQARLMSQAMRKLVGAVSKSKTCIVFINQLRQKIGVFFGNPETTTGGNALKFYSTMRLDIRRIGASDTKDKTVGNRTRVRVVKNKVAPPFKEAEFDIIYGHGICRMGELIDLGVQYKIIEQKGSWFNYMEERLGQGREVVKEFLVEHKKIAEEIEEKIHKA